MVRLGNFSSMSGPVAISVPEAPSDAAPLTAVFNSRRVWAGQWSTVALGRYLRAGVITALCTALAYPLFGHLDAANIVMVYLGGAIVAGLWLGRGPASLCAISSAAAFDYIFVPPRHSFYVTEPQYLLTLGGMLIVALVISNLMVSLRRQTQQADARARRTATLYAMCRELAGAVDACSITAVARPHVALAMEGEAAFVLCGQEHSMEAAGCDMDAELVRWVLQHGHSAGPGLQRPVNSTCLYLPLAGGEGINGVLVVRPRRPAELAPDARNMLEALSGQIAMALERARLAELAAAARLAAEQTALRNTLLASISHDLRAPLTAIAGAGCLVAQSAALDFQRRATLGQLIETKARDMAELLGNVLELIRLESTTSLPRADWQCLEELVGASVRQSIHRLHRMRVVCDIPGELPLLYLDGQLVRQMLSNLLENAAKYTPPGTTIVIRATPLASSALLIIEDDGPGFGAVDPALLFEKFERGRKESAVPGAGLGLAICRAIARLHGGGIRAMNRIGGGARFEIRLPLSNSATFARQRNVG
jgi:two-component system, OmpR family, sensor histidine kinase KdpD